MEKKVYYFVDVAKFLFAVSIVCLHSRALSVLPQDLNFWISKLILRLAVPFFFFATAFFFTRKVLTDETNLKEISKRYWKRLIFPLIVFQLINIFFETVVKVYAVDSTFSVVYVIRRILFYPFGSLWFIWACICASLLFVPFLKRNALWGSFFFGGVGYLWALLCNNYYFFVEHSLVGNMVDSYMGMFFSARNGVFVGLFYFGCAGLVAKYPRFFSFFRKKRTLVFFVLLYCMEIFLCKGKSFLDDSSLYILQVFVVASLFCNLTKLNPSANFLMLPIWRNMSVGIYFLHRAVMLFLSLIAIFLHVHFPNVVVFFLTMSISFTICFFSYKKGGVFARLLK